MNWNHKWILPNLLQLPHSQPKMVWVSQCSLMSTPQVTAPKENLTQPICPGLFLQEPKLSICKGSVDWSVGEWACLGKSVCCGYGLLDSSHQFSPYSRPHWALGQVIYYKSPLNWVLFIGLRLETLRTWGLASYREPRGTYTLRMSSITGQLLI